MGACMEKQASMPKKRKGSMPTEPVSPSVEDIILQAKMNALKNKFAKKNQSLSLRLTTIPEIQD